MEERIKEVMEYLGLSQQEFAQKLGISPASLSNIFNGRSKPTNNHVQAIHRAFPSISTNWLMFGEGVMFGDNGDKSPNDMCGSSSNVTPNIQGAENAVSKKNMDGMELFSNLSDSAGGNQNRERQAAGKAQCFTLNTTAKMALVHDCRFGLPMPIFCKRTVVKARVLSGL